MRSTIENLRDKNNYKTSLKEYVERFYRDQYLLANTIYNSNKIEGSSLTLGETLEVLNNESTDTPSIEELEVVGLRDAAYYLNSNYNKEIEESDLLLMHKLLLENIRPSAAGVYRIGEAYTYVRLPDTVIKKHSYLNHELVEKNMSELFRREIKTLDHVVKFKLDLASIHPFIDGNGRVSRLALNWLLVTLGYPPVIIKGDTTKARDKYIDAMSAYSLRGEVKPFAELLEEYLVESLNQFNTVQQSDIFGK